MGRLKNMQSVFDSNKTVFSSGDVIRGKVFLQVDRSDHVGLKTVQSKWCTIGQKRWGEHNVCKVCVWSCQNVIIICQTGIRTLGESLCTCTWNNKPVEHVGPVFSFGVSKHKHKTTSLWTFWLNWLSKLRENDERKIPLLDEFCVLSDRNIRLL